MGLLVLMVMEFFKLFIIYELIKWNLVINVKVVKWMIDKCDEKVFDVLEDVIKEYFVFLNCVFILYWLGI